LVAAALATTPWAAVAAFDLSWPTARAAAFRGAEVELASGRPLALIAAEGRAAGRGRGVGTPGPGEADPRGGASPEPGDADGRAHSESAAPALALDRIELSGGELYGVREARGFLARSRFGSRIGSATLTVGALGGGLYREGTVGLFLAKPLRGQAVVEIGCRVLSIHAAGLPERAGVAIDASVASRILGRVVLAAAWRNLGNARVGGSPVAAGASLGAELVLDGISLAGAIDLDRGLGVTVAFGSEAAVCDWLRLRAGVSVDPDTFGAGIGIGREARTRPAGAKRRAGLLTRPVVDLAVTWHPDLGGSSFATITFRY